MVTLCASAVIPAAAASATAAVAARRSSTRRSTLDEADMEFMIVGDSAVGNVGAERGDALAIAAHEALVLIDGAQGCRRIAQHHRAPHQLVERRVEVRLRRERGL